MKVAGRVCARAARRARTDLVYLLLLRMDIVVVTVAVVRMKLGVRIIIARIVIEFVQRITDGLIVVICRQAVEPQAVPLPSWIASPTPSTASASPEVSPPALCAISYSWRDETELSFSGCNPRIHKETGRVPAVRWIAGSHPQGDVKGNDKKRI